MLAVFGWEGLKGEVLQLPLWGSFHDSCGRMKRLPRDCWSEIEMQK
jgi:hypothetical protein